MDSHPEPEEFGLFIDIPDRSDEEDYGMAMNDCCRMTPASGPCEYCNGPDDEADGWEE